MSNDIEVESVEFANELDAWIAGSTLTHRSVAIYGDGQILAEIDDLIREHEVLVADAKGEPSLGDETQTRLREVEARLVELDQKKQESKATWVVRKLLAADFTRIEKEHPSPKAPDLPPLPDELPEDATDEQKAEYADQVAAVEAAEREKADEIAAYEAAAEQWVEDYNLASIARAVVKIRFANGREAAGVTIDQLRVLRDRLGVSQINKLSGAVQAAAKDIEPVIPAPFSRDTSLADRT